VSRVIFNLQDISQDDPQKTIKLQQHDNSRQITRADDRPTTVYLQEKIFLCRKRKKKKFYGQDAPKR
jgi:hypothetical protein